MFHKAISGLWFIGLSFFVSAGYANNNPVSVSQVNRMITEKIQALDIQPPVQVNQQTEGGIVIWLGGSKRSGIVALLQDPSFASGTRYFPQAVKLGAYPEHGMGGGYQNTVATLAVGGVTGVGPHYILSEAVQIVTNAAGEVGTSNCDSGATSGPRACLGGWYVPNLAEFYTMFNALCGTAYELTSGAVKYWTSTYAEENNGNVMAVNIPTNHNCNIANLIITQEDPTQDIEDGFTVRYTRQFGSW